MALFNLLKKNKLTTIKAVVNGANQPARIHNVYVLSCIDPRVDENYDYSSRSNIGDTGTSHPHGTKYKPKMVRFQSEGKSRSTGMEYTTTVIEAIGVEHKETTRNYDILAAAFTDVLKNLNEDSDYLAMLER